MRRMSADKPRYLGVFSFFEAVPEPRVERTRLHPLLNILIIVDDRLDPEETAHRGVGREVAALGEVA